MKNKRKKLDKLFYQYASEIGNDNAISESKFDELTDDIIDLFNSESKPDWHQALEDNKGEKEVCYHIPHFQVIRGNGTKYCANCGYEFS